VWTRERVCTRERKGEAGEAFCCDVSLPRRGLSEKGEGRTAESRLKMDDHDSHL